MKIKVSDARGNLSAYVTAPEPSTEIERGVAQLGARLSHPLTDAEAAFADFANHLMVLLRAPEWELHFWARDFDNHHGEVKLLQGHPIWMHPERGPHFPSLQWGVQAVKNQHASAILWTLPAYPKGALDAMAEALQHASAAP